MERYLFNLKIAIGALLHNKMRSLLTALGIIFGVASVIAMQAVGKGTQQDLLDQLKLVGVNNIMITQKIEDKAEKKSTANKKGEKGNASFGLSLSDGQVLKDLIPGVENFSAESSIKSYTVYNSKGFEAKLIGVTPSYFSILSRAFESGRNFDSLQISTVAPVCILSPEAKQKFFHSEPAVGKSIRCAYRWLQVTGVLAPIGMDDSARKKSGVSENAVEIYTPINSLLIRFGDRSFITRARLNAGNNNDDDDESDAGVPSNPGRYNQVDRIILQVKDSKDMSAIADVAAKILKRRHAGMTDFEIKIPEAELKQKQHTKDIFNLVLGIIAGISLLVGGIGIMNIMLVSVTERTREIGLRMALGATKVDIVQQFIAEAVMLSSGGGLIGVGLGIVISKSISGYFDIPTIFTFISLFIAFGFSVIVGLVFGIAPARRAARQNPIESLRYE
jgi:putative ABC transport system permease protein